MSNLLLRLALAVAVILPGGLFVSTTASAHGGVSLDDDRCVMRLSEPGAPPRRGRFVAHMAGYQPDTRMSGVFCEDVPVVGHAIFVVDLLSRELRDMPIEFRILKDTNQLGYQARYDGLGSWDEIQNATVYRLAPHRYERGSLMAEYTFDDEGVYIGLVSALGEDGRPKYVSVFPFGVGVVSASSYSTPIVATLLLGLVLVGLGWRAVRKSRQRAEEEAETASS